MQGNFGTELKLMAEGTAGFRRPRTGVGAIVLDEDRRILLVGSKTEGGLVWSIPGGAVAESEFVCDAVDREVMEETGLKVESKLSLAPLSLSLDGIQWISFPFLVDKYSGVPIVGEPRIACAVSWFYMRQLPRLNLISLETLKRLPA
jgi:ADP-ribose pyrophosphatase YjhB (NUDIX family)